MSFQPESARVSCALPRLRCVNTPFVRRLFVIGGLAVLGWLAGTSMQVAYAAGTTVAESESVSGSASTTGRAGTCDGSATCADTPSTGTADARRDVDVPVADSDGSTRSDLVERFEKFVGTMGEFVRDTADFATDSRDPASRQDGFGQGSSLPADEVELPSDERSGGVLGIDPDSGKTSDSGRSVGLLPSGKSGDPHRTAGRPAPSSVITDVDTEGSGHNDSTGPVRASGLVTSNPTVTTSQEEVTSHQGKHANHESTPYSPVPQKQAPLPEHAVTASPVTSNGMSQLKFGGDSGTRTEVTFASATVLTRVPVFGTLPWLVRNPADEPSYFPD